MHSFQVLKWPCFLQPAQVQLIAIVHCTASCGMAALTQGAGGGGDEQAPAAWPAVAQSLLAAAAAAHVLSWNNWRRRQEWGRCGGAGLLRLSAARRPGEAYPCPP